MDKDEIIGQLQAVIAGKNKPAPAPCNARTKIQSYGSFENGNSADASA
jgi:hypothetical protein